MEDLSAMLNQILGSEEGMAQLRGMAQALGIGQQGTPNGTNPAVSPSPTAQTQSGGTGQGMDLSGLAGMLSSLMNSSGNGGSASTPTAGPTLPNIDFATIQALQKAYQTFTARDKNTELLLALRPHFHDERQKKVDDAIRILGLIKILPLLKESGILGSLGGLLGGEE